MLKYLFGDFRLVYNQDNSHVLRTPGAARWVHLVYFLDDQGPMFYCKIFFGGNELIYEMYKLESRARAGRDSTDHF